MKSMSKLLTGVLGLVVSGLTGSAKAADTSTSAYKVLGEDSQALRDDFNRAKGTVRLLFVVGPTCPSCLRGLDDVNRDLLSKTDDPRLQTFVVHVPALGAKSQDVPP